MPQRSNIVGDLGTTKVASDCYDIDNIYLSEEGWVYRHYKNTDKTRWWDEILVAGQVIEADNEPCAETNPPKLGTIPDPIFETGGDNYKDFQYSTLGVSGGGVPNLDDTGGSADPSSTIGNVTLNNNTTTATTGDEVEYTVSYDGGANASMVSYRWSVTGAEALGSLSTKTLTVRYNEAGSASVLVTVFPADSAVTDGPTTTSLNVTVSDA